MKNVVKGVSDLATIRPDLVEEWDFCKNTIDPTQVNFGTDQKAWWICKSCGYSWQAKISNRVHGRGCPVCGNIVVWPGHNDLATMFPDIAKEYDINKNDNSPENVFPKSNIKVWWKCEKGHSYYTSPASRTNAKSGCPYCSGRLAIKGVNDLQTIYPDIAAEWDYEKNAITPDEVLPSSGIKYYWKCNKGHSWQAPPYNRIKGSGCSVCFGMNQTSLPEQAMLFYLSQSYNVESRVKICGCEVDIYLPDYNIGIEYDGLFYHNSSAAINRENNKNERLLKEGVRLIRVKEDKEKECVDGFTIYYKLLPNYNGLNGVINRLITFISSITGKERITDVDFTRDRLVILSNYRKYSIKKSFASEHPSLLEEWDNNNNLGLKPEAFSSGSNQKVWWRCKKCGQSWMASIAARSHGEKCPVCNNRLLVTGINDLQTTNPSLADEWAFEQNKGVTPDRVLGGTGKTYFWKCKKCGNIWRASVYDRSHGRECPICSKRKAANIKTIPKSTDDSLQSRFPAIAAKWDYEKNNGVTPNAIYPFSNKKYYWICDKGHSNYTTVNHMVTRNGGCPYCSGEKVLVGFNDLQTLKPDIAAEWDYSLNTTNPEEYTCGSNKIVCWSCPTCGNQYRASISNRTKKNGTGCPKCGRIKAAKSRRRKIINIDTGEVFESITEAARKYNKNHSTLSACLHGKTQTAFGYHWKYMSDQ